MCEAERHLIRSRLAAGLRQTAVRGELRQLLLRRVRCAREVRQAGAFELSVERAAMKPGEPDANTTRSSRKTG
jgi:hypothetical protein